MALRTCTAEIVALIYGTIPDYRTISWLSKTANAALGTPFTRPEKQWQATGALLFSAIPPPDEIRWNVHSPRITLNKEEH